MKRAPMKRKPAKNPGFTRAVKNQALTRSGGRCEAKTPVCTGNVEHYHHRQFRGQGGPNTLANALACCSACHRYIHVHANHDEALERGWIISAFAGQPQ